MSARPSTVVLFGELLLRLTTQHRERIVQAKSFTASYTGGEANAGALLAGLGIDARLVAAVPNNELGQACINEMRRFGMDTRHVQERGPRLGALYVEIGAAQRQSKVIYDRAASSFSLLKCGDIPWQEILRDADWFHFTGTAPALSSDLAELTLEGCRVAKSLGITVSCDLNYRSTLWTIEAARETLQRIVPHLNMLIANEEHARLLLDAPPARFADSTTVFDLDAYQSSLDWLHSNYGIRHVALTIRAGSTSDQTSFAAVLSDGEESHLSRIYQDVIVDRIGAGDAFTGGLIYTSLGNWELSKRVEFAAAAASLKHSILGDFCLASLDEISQLADHGPNSRVSR